MTSISFIPLDDRPCCLQFVHRLAELGGAELTSPPRPLLGNFLVSGQPDSILDWLADRQDPIVLASLDMICWGGLVASRQPGNSTTDQALARLQRFRQITQDRQVFAFDSILRNAPTQTDQTGIEQAEILTQLSVLAGRAQRGDHQAAALFEKTKKTLPAHTLEAYLGLRQRNHQLNRAVIQASPSWKALLMGLDDSKSEGWNLLELDQLEQNKGDHVLFAPGTDEMAHLLLTRCLAPGTVVEPIWSDQRAQHQITRYEDRPLKAVLESQAQAAGLRLGDSPRKLFLYVCPEPQQEAAAQAQEVVPPSFLGRLEEACRLGQAVVADLYYANGGSRSLVEALLERPELMEGLLGYSGWNTAGNSLGTALATLALAKPGPSARRFLLERLGDDYFYQSVARRLLKQQVGPGLVLESDQKNRAERQLQKLYREQFSPLVTNLRPGTLWNLSLPWSRLFEVSLELE